MSFIPNGNWAIDCVLINDATVLNNEGMRALELEDREWVIQPSGQRFKVTQMTSKSAVLDSHGETYYAIFEVNGSTLNLQLSRPNLKEIIRIEAEAITADVFVGMS